MFGIDDIGLLLGALSLLYAAVHDTTKVAGRIASFTSCEEERLKLITKICTQRRLLNLAVSKLLAPLLTKDEIDAMCETTSPLSWVNAQLTMQLHECYSQDLLAVFEIARLEIAKSSFKFLRSVGVTAKNGLDDTTLSPLHVLDQARANFDRGLGARLRYASHSSSIKKYFESIRDANQDIHNAIFDLLLEAPAQLTPIQVLICASGSVALPDDIATVQVSTGFCMLAESSLPLPESMRGFRANTNDATISAITTQVGNAGATSLDRRAQARLPSNKTTLLAVLPRRDRLSDFTRVTVASNVADSLAHLAGTPWLTPDVSKSDIAFFENPNLSTLRGPAFAEAYLGRNLYPPQLTQHPAGGFSSTYYQTIVLKMSMWFLELCAAVDRGHDNNPQQSLLAIIANAFSWLGELQGVHDGVVLDAALACLRLAMDPSLSFTDRIKDLEDFKSKVMDPLRAVDRALHLVR
nr:hypothetical protein B0A51_01723 [Rachicladosporium sp. CCFEE 5018]